MKKRLHYIIIPVLIAALGCEKKKYPVPESSGESVFYTRLVVNGQPLEITTGKNGYYMYSSYTMNSSNVYNLIGEYKQTGCSNCTNGLLIQVNDSKVSSPNSSIRIDSALYVKNYTYLSDNNNLRCSVSFAGSFNKAVSSVLWDFGDGTTSTELQPHHVFKSGKYQVSVTITGTNQCQSTMTNMLSLISANDLNAYVSASSASNTVLFTAHPRGGKAPYSYLWDFGDGTAGSGAIVNHSYTTKGGYGVKLKVTDLDGKTTTCYYNTVASNDPSACAANFSFPTMSYSENPLGLSQVKIQFTDATGTIFTSDNALQPSASDFRILSVEEFVKNENDQPVKKVKLEFNCTLYNGSKSLSLKGTEVLIGFAYKQ